MRISECGLILDFGWGNWLQSNDPQFAIDPHSEFRIPNSS